jgi:two-component system, LuxR family, response regulator FixJ
MTMSDAKPIVYVVDDDVSTRQSLKYLVNSVGLDAQLFDTATAFLEGYRPGRPACLLLDLRMPGMGGLELQEQMTARGINMPVIMLTAYAEVPAAVRAMKAGAVDFVEKPFSDHALLERIQNAVALAVREHGGHVERAAAAARLERLTPREHEVLRLVVAGLGNKQVAVELGLSAKTVEIHRANVMKKLDVSSLAELVRVAGAVST